MKNSLNIICHAFPSWKNDYVKSTVELMKELANSHRILYVDYHYTILDVIRAIFGKKMIPLSRILGFKTAHKEEIKNPNGQLVVLSLPPAIPTNWINNRYLHDRIQKFNARLIQSRLKKAFIDLSFKPSIMVNAFNPIAGLQLKPYYPNLKHLYYCYDNIQSTEWAAKHGSRYEDAFIKVVDGSIYSSETLLQSKAALSRGHLVRNGVNLKHFKAFGVPTKGPIKIGYLGSIDNRLDFELLEKLITSKHGWEFHFIGPVRTKKAIRLEQLPNTIFYGPKNAEELPDFLKDFNAGLIPFVSNGFTRNCYPMKANEYLALGLPVVMTPFAEFDDLEQHVSIAEASSFEHTLEEVIYQDNPERRLRRSALAQENSWANRAKELETVLFSYVD